MKRFLFPVVLCGLSSFAVLGWWAPSATAVDVVVAGSITSSNYSPTGSNLGTAGSWFANFNRDGGVNNAAPSENEVRQLPSYVTLSFGDTVDSAGGWVNYTDLTLPNGTVGNSGALEMNQPGAPGVAGTREDYLTLTFGAGAPNSLRLGLVIDNTDGLQFSNSQVLVNGVSTGPLTNDLVADVKFFDASNISPGDMLVVEGISSTDSVAHLGGFLLDIVIPEPSTAMLFVLLGSYLGCGRRIRKRRHD
jgi:hypothetical protein